MFWWKNQDSILQLTQSGWIKTLMIHSSALILLLIFYKRDMKWLWSYPKKYAFRFYTICTSVTEFSSKWRPIWALLQHYLWVNLQFLELLGAKELWRDVEFVRKWPFRKNCYIAAWWGFVFSDSSFLFESSSNFELLSGFKIISQFNYCMKISQFF